MSEQSPTASIHSTGSEFLERLRAFLVHLGASLLVVGGFAALVRWGWYPWPLLEIEGGLQIIGLLLAVDIIIGPSLTFLVFRRGKKELAFDISVIVALQLAAFVYGATIIHGHRPHYLVLANNALHLVTASDYDSAKLPAGVPAKGQGFGVTPVYLALPDDQVAVAQMTVDEMLAGRHISMRAEYYRPWPAPLWELRTYGQPLEMAREGSGWAQEVQDFRTAHGLGQEKLLAIRVEGRVGEAIGVVSFEDGRYIGMLSPQPSR